jgi:D-alanine-D-alanine ligase
MKKVLILFGGNSLEHAVSCKSAKTVLENIDKKLFDVTAVGIHDYTWYTFDDNLDMLLNNTWLEGNIKKVDNIIEFLEGFEKVLPMIHGVDGENGALAGLFELFNIPYVGSNILGHACGYDKEFTKIICEYHNIPQIEYMAIYENKEIKEINMEYPVIVKPSACGSSIGINVANNIDEVNKYVKEAFKCDSKVIIEKFIKCRELECAVLEKDNNIIVSTVGEIKSVNEFYDYESKYVLDSKVTIPAQIDESIIKEIQTYSEKIFKILSLRDLTRIDFLYDYENKQLYFNEVNTLPGFTTISMYPMLINNSGINIKELITTFLK